MPYTQNQYGTQYHLLETLILNDNPILSKITGSRPTTSMSDIMSSILEFKTSIFFAMPGEESIRLNIIGLSALLSQCLKKAP